MQLFNNKNDTGKAKWSEYHIEYVETGIFVLTVCQDK